MVTSPFSPGKNLATNKTISTYNPAPEKPSNDEIVLQMGDAVIASTETVTALADRMDELANQVQQQGYQIFALTEEVQNLTLLHQGTLDRLETLMTRLESLAD
jgi:conjugal transfer/entry exclusion protein